jgi:phage shock protein PspC (stress-responsive transcriptional regulator)
MRLTQKQDALIERYLREVNAHFREEISDRARDRGMARLQARIDHELKAISKDSIDDADVYALLDSLGNPEVMAAKLTPRRAAPETLGLSKEDRVWLGVCGGIGEYLEFPAWLVRMMAFLLGITTGPLSIIVYLGVYFWFHASAEEDVPPIPKARALWRVVSTGLVVLALHMGTLGVVWLIFFVQDRYLHRALPELGDWGWITVRSDELLFWVLSISLPLAVLSAMPLSNAWDYSLKRFVQAVVALYGLALSFGIASLLVGLIKDYVKEFTG